MIDYGIKHNCGCANERVILRAYSTCLLCLVFLRNDPDDGLIVGSKQAVSHYLTTQGYAPIF